MSSWLASLPYDPLPPILAAGNPALEYFARRDLLAEEVGSPKRLWQLTEGLKIVRSQQEDGAWRYPGGGKEKYRPTEDYNQLETYRRLGELVEKYAATRSHPAVHKAAQFLFSRQSVEGDFRGIYGNLYSPNYSAAIMELLIKAGYGADERIEKAFRWLLSIRQSDGGWAIPLATVGAKWDVPTMGGPTLQPDRSRPFSHMVTGVVLRAFAAHPEYRKSKEAAVAGGLLASRFFQRDPHPGRNTPEFWTKFCYPFWFTDLLSSLDSLSLIGCEAAQAQIRRGLDWFIERQQKDGIWKQVLLRSGKDKQTSLWVGLAICCVLKRVHS